MRKIFPGESDNVVSGFTNDLSMEILRLIPYRQVKLQNSRDHLDLISWQVYNSYDYWSGLAIYNKVINPTNLISQGITSLVLFKKSEYDSLVKGLTIQVNYPSKLWLV